MAIGNVASIARRPGEFYGTATRTARIGAQLCSAVDSAAGTITPDHHHERPYLCIVLAGGYVARTPAAIEHEPEMLAFHPAGEVHGERFGRVPVRTLNVELDAGLIERFASAALGVSEPWTMRDVATGWMGGLIRREFDQPDELSALAIESALAMTFTTRQRAARRESTLAPAVRRALALLHERFREPVALTTLALAAGVPEGRLVAAFRAAVGRTPAEYQRGLRLDLGLTLLRRTPDPIAEIALAAGFADQSHFTRCVKRATGLPPRAYRRAAGMANVQHRTAFVQDDPAGDR